MYFNGIYMYMSRSALGYYASRSTISCAECPPTIGARLPSFLVFYCYYYSWPRIALRCVCVCVSIRDCPRSSTPKRPLHNLQGCHFINALIHRSVSHCNFSHLLCTQTTHTNAMRSSTGQIINKYSRSISPLAIQSMWTQTGSRTGRQAYLHHAFKQCVVYLLSCIWDATQACNLRTPLPACSYLSCPCQFRSFTSICWKFAHAIRKAYTQLSSSHGRTEPLWYVWIIVVLCRCMTLSGLINYKLWTTTKCSIVYHTCPCS